LFLAQEKTHCAKGAVGGNILYSVQNLEEPLKN